MNVPLDRIVDKIVGLGVPGLVLLIAVYVGGYAGGAALVAALAALGGPLGMIGGIALLGILVLISKGIADYGFERILRAALMKMRAKGKQKAVIISELRGYWFISSKLKERMVRFIEDA
ncbi:MAG TPA: hypothetical protein PK668_13225 [Myxococcota bacterium]|nr:hypothetical protein [Myxococcota bacterium]HRY93570.1 hypothetical protein [Myxococcota bacterium]